MAIVGSINADLTVFSSELPRPGETVIGETLAIGLGGKGANQAIGAARAGAEVHFIGAVGDDDFAKLTTSVLEREGIDLDTVHVTDGPTGVAHIRVDTTTGQNDIVIVPNANAHVSPARAEQALRALADRISVVLVQLEIPVDTVVHVARICAELDLTLVLDPAPAQPLPDDLWAGVSVVKPNETEAQILTGIEVTDADSAGRAARWFLERGVDTVVITRGGDGVVLCHHDEVREVSAFDVEVVDTTASGDAFAGALGASLANGDPLADAVRRAMAAGALAATTRGASSSLPTADRIDDLIAAEQSS